MHGMGTDNDGDGQHVLGARSVLGHWPSRRPRKVLFLATVCGGENFGSKEFPNLAPESLAAPGLGPALPPPWPSCLSWSLGSR